MANYYLINQWRKKWLCVRSEYGNVSSYRCMKKRSIGDDDDDDEAKWLKKRSIHLLPCRRWNIYTQTQPHLYTYWRNIDRSMYVCVCLWVHIKCAYGAQTTWIVDAHVVIEGIRDAITNSDKNSYMNIMLLLFFFFLFAHISQLHSIIMLFRLFGFISSWVYTFTYVEYFGEIAAHIHLHAEYIEY